MIMIQSAEGRGFASACNLLTCGQRLEEELLFDAKDSGNVLFLHEKLRWIIFSLNQHPRFLECQAKQHAAKNHSIYDNESEPHGQMHMSGRIIFSFNQYPLFRECQTKQHAAKNHIDTWYIFEIECLNRKRRRSIFAKERQVSKGISNKATRGRKMWRYRTKTTTKTKYEKEPSPFISSTKKGQASTKKGCTQVLP